MTKVEAYRLLKQLVEEHGAEFTQFLAEIEGHLSDEDFKQLRLIVGGVMGQGHYEALVAISNEMPELTPQWLERIR